MIDQNSAIAGLILAGGRSLRMNGADKALLTLGGLRLIDHAIARLRPQVGPLAINANGDPSRFSGLDLPILADSLGDHEGPLAGILAGLEWASGQGASHLATVAVDTPFFPVVLVETLADALVAPDMIVIAASDDGTHPVFGLWPTHLGPTLRRHLESGGARKVTRFVDAYPHGRVLFPPRRVANDLVDPFMNINRPDELAMAEALLDQTRTGTR